MKKEYKSPIVFNACERSFFPAVASIAKSAAFAVGVTAGKKVVQAATKAASGDIKKSHRFLLAIEGSNNNGI